MTEAATERAVVLLEERPEIDHAIMLWLDEVTSRSHSAHTERAYREVMTDFRATLRAGLADLDSDSRLVAAVAQRWADQYRRTAQQTQIVLDEAHAVAAATFNARLAILSSFYSFAQRRELFFRNPIKQVKRRPVQAYRGAQPLTPQTVAECLAAIDRSTLLGKRDYALLAIALQTGRRRSELAALRWGDVAREGNLLTLTFRHAKGGKLLVDRLALPTAQALYMWLTSAYGDLRALAPDAPLFFSLARNGSHERPLSTEALSQIMERRMGTRKVHVTRHTFAVTMEALGAKVSDIQARLGHSSLQTTSIYLAALHAGENPLAEMLAATLGIAPDAESACPPFPATYPVVEQATTPQSQEEPVERSNR